jgi:P-type E1-E2 ATPase
VSNGDETKHIIIRTLDMVIIAIPPALPAAMSVGIVFAQKRLRRQQIFCINPRCINMCGAINAFCFDKTGTMTEDGLDMWGVVPVRDKKYDSQCS